VAGLFAALLLAGSAGSLTAGEPARSAPSRPAGANTSPAPAIPTRKIGGIDYVRVEDIATRLGLRVAWVERGRKLTLTGPSARADLENDTRDITVNGVRVFLGDPIVEASGQLYVSRIDFERCLAPMLRPGYGVAPVAAPKTIVLDPGHGGRDSGTSSNEKVYALDVAKRARKVLEDAGFAVILTREEDIFIELPQRPALANAAGADLYVSIHFNALERDTRTSGMEIYTYPPQFQRSANSWSLNRTSDANAEAMPANRHDQWSVTLAHSIHRRFISELKTFDRGKKLMHLVVLKTLDCPGVLVECGFLTSETEARKIAAPEYRQQLAEAIAGGVRDYAGTVGRVRAQPAPKK
jgi:N-acetylmuramoyl-L-alanine amidase